MASDDSTPDANPAPAVPAQGHRTGRGFVTSFAEDRVCSRIGCTTKLSRYNAQALCGIHEVSAQRHR